MVSVETTTTTRRVDSPPEQASESSSRMQIRSVTCQAPSITLNTRSWDSASALPIPLAMVFGRLTSLLGTARA